MKAFMNWSGGKDSALALYKAIQKGIPVEALVTSVNSSTNRISMHGVRRELLEQQAASVGLPLYTIELPEMPDMKMYEEAVQKVHRHLAQEGFTHGIFGDIFLEDLKRYRQELLAKDGLDCLFPLWQQDSVQLVNEFISKGFEAVIVCTESNHLGESFCGGLLNKDFLFSLPLTVDPCGENGEYHSFVFDGPIFSSPIPFKKGDIVFKEYPAPGKDDCFTTPQQAAGFYFQNLMPCVE